MKKLIFLALFLSNAAFGTITFVQKNAACCGTPTVITLPGATATGNILLASPSVLGDTTHSVSSISGGGVTTWHKATSSSTFSLIELWWGVVTSGSSTSITINYTGASSLAESWVAEFHSSVAGTWTIDQTNTGSASATSVSSGNATTTVATELLFAGASSASNNWSSGPSGSFTQLGTNSDFMQGAYRIVTSTGTYSTSWSFPSGGADAAIATFYVSTASFVPANIY